MPARQQGGRGRAGFEHLGGAGRRARLVRGEHIVAQIHDALAGIAGAMRVEVGAQLRLARLRRDGVGGDFQLHRIDHGGAHLGVGRCDVKLLAPLHEQFLANHVVEHFAPLRGRGVRQIHGVQRLQLQQIVAAGNRLLIDQGHIFRRHHQSRGAARGEQRVSRRQQSAQGAAAHEKEGSPAAHLAEIAPARIDRSRHHDPPVADAAAGPRG